MFFVVVLFCSQSYPKDIFSILFEDKNFINVCYLKEMLISKHTTKIYIIYIPVQETFSLSLINSMVAPILFFFFFNLQLCFTLSLFFLILSVTCFILNINPRLVH